MKAIVRKYANAILYYEVALLAFALFIVAFDFAYIYSTSMSHNNSSRRVQQASINSVAVNSKAFSDSCKDLNSGGDMKNLVQRGFCNYSSTIFGTTK